MTEGREGLPVVDTGQRWPSDGAVPPLPATTQAAPFHAGAVSVSCAPIIKVVDYKNVGFLRRFISDRARIETRRKTSACAKHQRALATAIKRARHLALLPYTAEHIRGSGMSHR
jgi:ribosomal protein S18